MNAYLVALARSEALKDALLTAIERAQGAAGAKKKKWEKRQMLAAARHAGALAKLLGAQPRRARAAAAAFKAADLGVTVTPERAAELQRRVASGDIPASFENLFFKLFRRFGDGRTLADTFVAELLAATPQQLSGHFPQAWIAPKILRGYRTEAKAMRAIAKQARARPFATY